MPNNTEVACKFCGQLYAPGESCADKAMAKAICGWIEPKLVRKITNPAVIARVMESLNTADPSELLSIMGR